MKVLVCGGRDYKDTGKIGGELSFIDFTMKRITYLIHGGASGADSIAKAWAEAFGIPTKEYKPAWDIHGKAAGPIRNKTMLDDNPDIVVVVAFPGGTGTASMVRLAKQRNIKVIEILP